MRCPVCKAENVQGPQCRRCKADLSLLFTLEDQRTRVLAEARESLAHGRWRQAAGQAAQADWLRSDEESRGLVALAHLLNREYAQAWESYERMKEVGLNRA